MKVAVVGISYKNTDLKIREQVVFSDTKKMEAQIKLLDLGIDDVVIVATCNRSEIYFVCDDDKQIEEVKQLYSDLFKLDLSKYLFSYSDKAAIQYLFEVACGIHSLVVGEDQILGQIVDSHEFSLNNGMSKKALNHIFRETIHCAKQVKNNYQVSNVPLSLSYIGIKLISEKMDLKNCDVLVLGSGKMSQLCIPYLIDNQVKNIYNANRSIDNAKKLQDQFSCLKVIDFKSVDEYIPKVDVVISATACPHVIVKKHDDFKVDHQMAMLDLAVPRDIDEKFNELDNVSVYDLDSLQNIADENGEIRLKKLAQASSYIEEEVNKSYDWFNKMPIDETIVSLQDKVDNISEQAYNFLLKKLNLDEREKYILKKTIDSSLQKVIREPIKHLKKGDINCQKTIKKIFNVEE